MGIISHIHTRLSAKIQAYTSSGDLWLITSLLLLRSNTSKWRSHTNGNMPAGVPAVWTPTGALRGRTALKAPIHVRVWLASPAGLGFKSVKLVRVWSVTSRTWPILAWLVRAFGGARLAAGLLLARKCVGGPTPDSRIHTATSTASFLLQHVITINSANETL